MIRQLEEPSQQNGLNAQEQVANPLQTGANFDTYRAMPRSSVRKRTESGDVRRVTTTS